MSVGRQTACASSRRECRWTPYGSYLGQCGTATAVSKWLTHSVRHRSHLSQCEPDVQPSRERSIPVCQRRLDVRGDQDRRRRPAQGRSRANRCERPVSVGSRCFTSMPDGRLAAECRAWSCESRPPGKWSPGCCSPTALSGRSRIDSLLPAVARDRHLSGLELEPPDARTNPVRHVHPDSPTGRLPAAIVTIHIAVSLTEEGA